MKNHYVKRLWVVLSVVVVSSFFTKLIFLPESGIEDSFLNHAFLKLILIVAAIIVIWKEKIFNRKYFFRYSMIIIPVALMLMYYSLSGTAEKISHDKLPVSDYEHYAYTAQCFLVGFFEEFLVRILIFGYLCMIIKNNGKHYYKEVIIASAIFALLHLLNLFSPEYDPLSVINQIVLAFSLGVFLQSVFIKFNNIILNGVLHGLINYYGTINPRLFKIEDLSDETYNWVDSLQTIGILALITILIIFPICYLMIRKEGNRIINYGNTQIEASGAGQQ